MRGAYSLRRHGKALSALPPGPEESKRSWDYYKPVATIAANYAFQPLSASRCPLFQPLIRR